VGEDVKKMADMLRGGATMLSEQCPVCSSPLFKLHDETFCVKCNRRVVIVKEGEEAPQMKDEREVPPVASATVSALIEETALAKLQEIISQARGERDAGRLQQLGSSIMTWLEVLEKVKKIGKHESS